jgi:hypothetical protein
MTTTFPSNLNDKFVSRVPTTASSISTASITASSISASTISSTNISKKELFLARLAILKEETHSALIWKKRRIKKVLKSLKSLIEDCHKAANFEGQSEVLLILSVYEVKLKKIIGS